MRRKIMVCSLVFCIVLLAARTGNTQENQPTTQEIFNLFGLGPMENSVIGSFSPFHPLALVNPLIGGTPALWPPISPLAGKAGLINSWSVNAFMGGFGSLSLLPMMNPSMSYSPSVLSPFSSLNSLSGAEMEVVIQSNNRCIIGQIGSQYSNIWDVMSMGIPGTIIPNSEFTFYEKPYILVMPDFGTTYIPVQYKGK